MRVPDVRFQSVKPAELDDAVIELFRLAKQCCGDYDGWETQVIPGGRDFSAAN
jgi:hypothetical protein